MNYIKLVKRLVDLYNLEIMLRKILFYCKIVIYSKEEEIYRDLDNFLFLL